MAIEEEAGLEARFDLHNLYGLQRFWLLRAKDMGTGYGGIDDFNVGFFVLDGCTKELVQVIPARCLYGEEGNGGGSGVVLRQNNRQCSIDAEGMAEVREWIGRVLG